MILKLINIQLPFKIIINIALGKCLETFWEKRRMSPLVATEFTTRGQSPMQASIYFASITVVLLKN